MKNHYSIFERTYSTTDNKHPLLFLPYPLHDLPRALRESISIRVRARNTVEFEGGSGPGEGACGFGDVVVDSDVGLFSMNTSVESVVD